MGTCGDWGKDDYPLLIGPSGDAVIARLIDREHLVTRAVGSLFPEGFDIGEAGRVLDLACSPGAWVHEVALHYPEIEAVGIDLSRPVLDYARDGTKEGHNPHQPLRSSCQRGCRRSLTSAKE